VLSLDEVQSAIRVEMRIGPNSLSDADIKKVFKIFDADDSGDVTISELLAFLYASGMQLRDKKREIQNEDVRKKLVNASTKNGVKREDWPNLFQRYQSEGSSGIAKPELRQAIAVTWTLASGTSPRRSWSTCIRR